MQEGGRTGSSGWRMLSRVREGVGEGVGRWFDENTRRVLSNGRDTLSWYDTWVGEIPLKIKFPRLFELAVNKECRVEEIWRMRWGDGGEAWVWHCHLLAWEEKSLRECTILLYNTVLQDDVTDR